MESPLMDTTTLPLELTKAFDKADKLNERAVRNAGYGAHSLSLKITKDYLGIVAARIASLLTEQQHPNSQLEAAFRVIKDLDPSVLALTGLSVALHGVALNMSSTAMSVEAGKGVARECFALGLTQYDAKLAARIEKETRANHSNVNSRYASARAMVRHANTQAAKERRDGYKVHRWTNDKHTHVGNWLLNAVVEALPEIFEWVETYADAYTLTVNAARLAEAEEAVAEAVLRQPVYLPLAQETPAWTSWTMQHPDPRINYGMTFLRTHYKDVVAACKDAIEDGSMKPALDGVSALQSVAWRINTRVLEVMKACLQRGVDVPGLPSSVDVPMPPQGKPFDDMTVLEQRLWKMDASRVRRENRTLVSERLSLAEDMQIADYCAGMGRYWTPMNCDWRGRVYSTCHFNFAREDRVRALFEFADGEPIGEDGLRWLKIHLANCGAFDKIDKKPLEDRAWVDDWMPRFHQIALHPMSEVSLAVWTKADKPFLFLAAAMELSAALHGGTGYVTRLPVSFDASASGLQHLSAMCRDDHTARLVNLTPCEPQDLYSLIASDVQARVDATKDDTFYSVDKKTKEQQVDPAPNQIARQFLAYGIDRKICKRNVMTYSYSSKKFGMGSQQQVDLMDPLSRDVLRGKLEEHPFAPHHRGAIDKPGKAARFIASYVYECIEAQVQRPAAVMKFLQSLAKTTAHEGKPLRWTTPTGLPWINRYHDPIVMRLRLYLHDRGVKEIMNSRVTVGHEPEINKERAANAVAPNFVHACDASHLILTVNAAVAEGIKQIATVHDSFGCLASRAGRFNQIIREEFVRMYTTHDVLAEVQAQAKCDLTQHTCDRIADVPAYGNLNLKEILNATFAFA
jgi:DNA-directed RNA polymerase, mitochondrial